MSTAAQNLARFKAQSDRLVKSYRGENRAARHRYRAIIDKSLAQGANIIVRLRERRQLREDNLLEKYRQFAERTSLVLNEAALQQLATHANIAAPTFTSIYSGYEHARASRAEREQIVLDAEAQRVKRDMSLDVETAKLQREDLSSDRQASTALLQREGQEIGVEMSTRHGVIGAEFEGAEQDRRSGEARDFTLKRDAAGRDFTRERDAAGRKFTLHRDAAGRDFTRERDAAGRKFTLHRDAAGRDFTRERDAAGRDFTLHRDAAGRDFTLHRDAAGRDFTRERDAAGRDFTRERDAAGRDFTWQRDVTGRMFKDYQTQQVQQYDDYSAYRDHNLQLQRSTTVNRQGSDRRQRVNEALRRMSTPPSTAVTPPSTAVTPPSTAVTPPSTAVTPPSTAVTPPSTAVTPPSTAVTPPSTAVTPPSTAVTPPSTAVTPPSTAVSPVSPDSTVVTPVSPDSTVVTPVAPPSTAVIPPSTAVTPDSTEDGASNLKSLLLGAEGGGDNPYFAFNKGHAGDSKGQSVDFSSLTIGEVKRRQALPRSHPDSLFAVGAYQFIPNTLNQVAKDMGVSDNERFTSELQDRMFAYGLVKKQPELFKYLAGENDDIRAAHIGLSKEFASAPDPDTGLSRYGDVGSNKAQFNTDTSGRILADARLKAQALIDQGISVDDAVAHVVLGTEPLKSETATDDIGVDYTPPVRPPLPDHGAVLDSLESSVLARLEVNPDDPTAKNDARLVDVLKTSSDSSLSLEESMVVQARGIVSKANESTTFDDALELANEQEREEMEKLRLARKLYDNYLVTQGFNIG